MNLKNRFNSYIYEILDLSQIRAKVVIYLILISLVFFYPVLYAHAIYADDLYRLKTGQYLWLADGRPLAYLVAKIYTLTNTYVIDPTPFNWIFAIIAIGLSAKLIYLYFQDNYKESSFLLASIFIINPFFIQNMLYRFDSIGMSLAIFFCVLSFSIKQKFFFTRVFLLFVCINFYQPASNLFLGLIAIDTLMMFHCKYHYDGLKKRLLGGIGVFFIATLFYFFEKKLFLHVTPGRSDMLGLSMWLPYELFKNYINAFAPFFLFWKMNFIFILPAIILMIVSLFKNALFDKDIRLLGGYTLGFVIIFVSSLGFMAFLTYQIDFFQVRIYMYFPIIIMFIYIVCNGCFSRLAKIILIPIIFVCLIFSARVGNIQQLQSEFEKPIFYSLTEDIYTIDKSYSLDKIYSLGQVPYSAFVANALSSTPFYGYMTRYEGDTKTRLLEYGNEKVQLKFQDSPESLRATFEEQKKMKEILLVLDKPYYNVYVNSKLHQGWIIWKNVWLL